MSLTTGISGLLRGLGCARPNSGAARGDADEDERTRAGTADVSWCPPLLTSALIREQLIEEGYPVAAPPLSPSAGAGATAAAGTAMSRSPSAGSGSGCGSECPLRVPPRLRRLSVLGLHVRLDEREVARLSHCRTIARGLRCLELDSSGFISDLRRSASQISVGTHLVTSDSTRGGAGSAGAGEEHRGTVTRARGISLAGEPAPFALGSLETLRLRAIALPDALVLECPQLAVCVAGVDVWGAVRYGVAMRSVQEELYCNVFERTNANRR